MNKEEMISILGIIKTAYPRFYQNMTVKEAKDTIDLWLEMFKDIDLITMSIAVKSLISHFEYPPTIADIRKEIEKLGNKQADATDLWVKAYEMLSNGIYMTQEKFDTYPYECKKFFGNTTLLREMSSDEHLNLDVVRSNFLKQIDTIQKKQREQNTIPAELKTMITGLANKLSLGE